MFELLHIVFWKLVLLISATTVTSGIFTHTPTNVSLTLSVAVWVWMLPLMLSLLELIMAEMKHRKIFTKCQRKREILNSKNQELRKSALLPHLTQYMLATDKFYWLEVITRILSSLKSQVIQLEKKQPFNFEYLRESARESSRKYIFLVYSGPLKHSGQYILLITSQCFFPDSIYSFFYM